MPMEARIVEPAEDDGLWDAVQVAKHIHASRSLVYKLAQAGRIPYVKVAGTMLRFDPKVIRAWARGEVLPAGVTRIGPKRAGT